VFQSSFCLKFPVNFGSGGGWPVFLCPLTPLPFISISWRTWSICLTLHFHLSLWRSRGSSTCTLPRVPPCNLCTFNSYFLSPIWPLLFCVLAALLMIMIHTARFCVFFGVCCSVYYHNETSTVQQHTASILITEMALSLCIFLIPIYALTLIYLDFPRFGIILWSEWTPAAAVHFRRARRRLQWFWFCISADDVECCFALFTLVYVLWIYESDREFIFISCSGLEAYVVRVCHFDFAVFHFYALFWVRAVVAGQCSFIYYFHF